MWLRIVVFYCYLLYPFIAACVLCHCYCLSVFPMKLSSSDSLLCLCPLQVSPKAIIKTLLFSTKDPMLAHLASGFSSFPGFSTQDRYPRVSVPFCVPLPTPPPHYSPAVSDSLCHLSINWWFGPADALSHMANTSAKWMPKTPPAPSGKWHFGKWNV